MEFRPFRISLHTRFRGTTERHGVLIRAEGWGEYSPFPDYDAERSSRWWRAALEAAHLQWPAPIRNEVAVNAIVPEVGPLRAAELAKSGGCRTVKVKVAGTPTEGGFAADIARVEAVARSLGPQGKVRVDANGGWDVDTAARALTEINAAVRDAGLGGLEYVEQPCATVYELVELRKRTSTLIAADELIRIPTDPLAVIRAGAADVVVLKVSPLGGVRACLELAEQVGVPVVVSSAMESSVGLAAGVALARALPETPFAHGLGTGSLLASDTVKIPVVPVQGFMRAPDLEVVV